MPWLPSLLLPAVISGTATQSPEITVVDAWQLFQESSQDPTVRRRQWDDLQAMSALQGIVNRNGPRLYLNLVGDQGKIDRYWWAHMRRPGSWLSKGRTAKAYDIRDLLQTYRRSIRGLVVWDERVPATSNVASTIAGAENLLPVRYDPAKSSLYYRLVGDPYGPNLPIVKRLINEDGTSLFTGKGVIPETELPSTGSAKCDAYVWAVEKYLETGKCQPQKMGYYPDAFWLQRPNKVPVTGTLLSNHDYFVAQKGFFFDLGSWDDEAPDDDPGQPLGTDVATLQRILRTAWKQSRGGMIHVGGFTPWDLKYTDVTGQKNGGVATEWRYAEILSCFNAYMDADAPSLGPMANASLFQHFPLRPQYKQPAIPSPIEMIINGWVGSHGRPASKPFVAFYVGDYDSAAWLYRMMPEVWDDEARGKVPLGWAINPNLESRFPLGLDYARSTATEADAFITGDSGAGYLNPGYLVPPRRWSDLPSGLEAWITHSRPLYKRWGLDMTGFIIDGNAPPMTEEVLQAYAGLSPAGVVAQKIPPASLVNGVPFLQMGSDLTGDDLDALARKIANDTTKGKTSFHLYRTILWTPTKHRLLAQKVRALRPDIEFVTPRHLMHLLRLQLGG